MVLFNLLWRLQSSVEIAFENKKLQDELRIGATVGGLVDDLDLVDLVGFEDVSELA